MYNEWAQQTSTKIKGILDEARKGHADAVRTRIEDVKPLSNVVDITKSLFEVSKVRRAHYVPLCFCLLHHRSNIATGDGPA